MKTPRLTPRSRLTRRFALLLTLAAVALGSPAVLQAHDTGKPDKKIERPASLGALWKEIDRHYALLGASVQSKKLAEVHEHAFAVRDAVAMLPSMSGDLPADKKARVEGAVKNVAKLATDLDNTGDAGNQSATESNLKKLDAVLKQLRAQYPPAAFSAAAETKPGAEAAAGEKDRGAMADRKAEADHGHGTAVPTVRAELRPKAPFQAGVESPVILRLSRLSDGKPVTFADLALAHTKKIHLLIVDEALASYTHEHPEETSVPGEYAFTWKPAAGGTFRVWADLVPAATNAQEYAPTVIQVAGTPAKAQRDLARSVTVDGYRFELSTENNAPVRAGEAVMTTVRVFGPDGKPFTKLEPVMGAYAHGVGFPEDLSGVLHVHPMGEEPQKDSERGGPELAFHLLPEKAGFQRFYVQVQIEGKDRYAGFGLKVEPAAAAPSSASAASTAAPAASPAVDGAKFLAAYEGVRAALAADDLAAAKSAAAASELGEEGKAVSASADLKAARAAFAKLSARAVPLAAGRAGLYVVRCPMTPLNGGRWVQTNAKVNNPYFGKTMLACGAVEK